MSKSLLRSFSWTICNLVNSLCGVHLDEPQTPRSSLNPHQANVPCWVGFEGRKENVERLLLSLFAKKQESARSRPSLPVREGWLIRGTYAHFQDDLHLGLVVPDVVNFDLVPWTGAHDLVPSVDAAHP